MGRALGVGARWLGHAAARWLAGDLRPASACPQRQTAAIHADGNQAHPAAAYICAQAEPALRGGVGGFLRPFGRVGRILWLEVTGTLFLLPAVVFTPALVRNLRAYAHTDDHRPLWVAAGVVSVFLYLGISSFWRAHRLSTRK